VLGHKFSLPFLLTEWDQVVDAWQLETWDKYRDVARLGRKTNQVARGTSRARTQPAPDRICARAPQSGVFRGLQCWLARKDR